jgi:hypothetical protein
MKRKTATLILSFGIFCCFFLPLFEWHNFEMTGLNYVISSHIPRYKYVLLLIPFFAIFLFFGALNDEKYLFNRLVFSWLPFLSLVFIMILRYMYGGSENNSSDSGNAFSNIDFGFWLMLLSSFLLVLVMGQKENLYQYPKKELEPLK